MADIFYNDAGRVRSVWRLAIFCVAFVASAAVVFNVTDLAARLLLPGPAYKHFFDATPWFVIQAVLLFGLPALIGWGCAWFLEDLPWRSLGWALHGGWLRDAVVGTLVGGASVCVAAAAGAVAGVYQFTFAGFGAAFVQTLLYSGFLFVLGAACEEMLFRGYPMQTLLRSWPLWVAVLPVSVPFGIVHLWNPNVAAGFTFVNTALAGVWLGVCYWRTRSLWFPFGVHFGWNWVQGAWLGSPVSGFTKIAPDPLLRFADVGPAWVGGGSYGVEGGALCTLALVVSTLFVWRTGLLKATPEMKQYTDGENPNPQTAHVTPT